MYIGCIKHAFKIVRITDVWSHHLHILSYSWSKQETSQAYATSPQPGLKEGPLPWAALTAQPSRKEAGRQTCLPLQKNSRKSAGMGRTYLLKGSFAPVYRLCSDIAAISTLGWPGCCLSASCKVTGPASCLNPNSGHHSLLWNSIFV